MIKEEDNRDVIKRQRKELENLKIEIKKLKIEKRALEKEQNRYNERNIKRKFGIIKSSENFGGIYPEIELPVETSIIKNKYLKAFLEKLDVTWAMIFELSNNKIRIIDDAQFWGAGQITGYTLDEWFELSEAPELKLHELPDYKEFIKSISEDKKLRITIIKNEITRLQKELEELEK